MKNSRVLQFSIQANFIRIFEVCIDKITEIYDNILSTPAAPLSKDMRNSAGLFIFRRVHGV